jgi:hypothetical protein
MSVEVAMVGAVGSKGGEEKESADFALSREGSAALPLGLYTRARHKQDAA